MTTAVQWSLADPFEWQVRDSFAGTGSVVNGFLQGIGCTRQAMTKPACGGIVNKMLPQVHY